MTSTGCGARTWTPLKMGGREHCSVGHNNLCHFQTLPLLFSFKNTNSFEDYFTLTNPPFWLRQSNRSQICCTLESPRELLKLPVLFKAHPKPIQSLYLGMEPSTVLFVFKHPQVILISTSWEPLPRVIASPNYSSHPFTEGVLHNLWGKMKMEALL